MSFSWHIIKHAQIFSTVRSPISVTNFSYIYKFTCFSIHYMAISLLNQFVRYLTTLFQLKSLFSVDEGDNR